MTDTALPFVRGSCGSTCSRGLLVFTGLAFALIATFWIYQFGFSAIWTFDDSHSLAGLEQVRDFSSAATFVLGNNTGPTGRPLSMLTFLVNLDDWHGNPVGFRQINALIHLINVALVMAIAWLTSRNVPSLSKSALGFAAALALVWGLHPLLASTVLSIVQRMSLLSAFFVLLGIFGYLVGRARLPKQRAKGMSIIAASLILCISLGTFSKENALLLPSYIGLLELTILSRYRPIRLAYWRHLGYLFLWGPILLFAAYVAYSWPAISTAQTLGYRSFDWSQRFWSEMLILWEYVRQVFVPDIGSLGPMQDDTTRIKGLDLYTLTATLSWVAALAASFVLRKRYPILLFGIGFFLIGHLIESSFIQLELYFEHRNYVASLGLLVIPIALAWRSEKLWPRLAVWFGVIPLLALLLFLTSRGWGDPGLSSQRWYQAHPTSLRAIKHRASVIEHFEDLSAAADFLMFTTDQQPDDLGLAAVALSYQCEANRRLNGLVLLKRIQQLIDNPHPLQGAASLVGFIEGTLIERTSGKCPWLEYGRLLSILEEIASDPALLNHPADLARYHLNMGLLQLATGNTVGSLNSLHQAFSLHRNYQIFGFYTAVLRGLGLTAEAEQIRDEYLATRPSGIFTMQEHRRRVLDAYPKGRVRIVQAPTIKPLLGEIVPKGIVPEIVRAPTAADAKRPQTHEDARDRP